VILDVVLAVLFIVILAIGDYLGFGAWNLGFVVESKAFRNISHSTIILIFI
jgi:hypothetical protein